MRLTTCIRFLLITALLASSVIAQNSASKTGGAKKGAAKNGAAKGEWRYYGADGGSTKYSPLDQINKNTVRNLRIVWRQSATPVEARRGVNAPAPT